MSVGPHLPRRTALALAAGGLVAVTGCDDGSAPGPRSATTSSSPDVALVDRVLRQLAAAQRVAEAHGDRDLAALHRAHIEALDGTPRTASVPRKAAPGTLASSEKWLRRQLETGALEAESGALARLLASMSAAVAQRLAGGAA